MLFVSWHKHYSCQPIPLPSTPVFGLSPHEVAVKNIIPRNPNPEMSKFVASEGETLGPWRNRSLENWCLRQGGQPYWTAGRKLICHPFPKVQRYRLPKKSGVLQRSAGLHGAQKEQLPIPHTESSILYSTMKIGSATAIIASMW